jgi:hypothetical protein
MGSSSSDPLSRLQRDLLEAFFARSQGFFLTGGAALAGFSGEFKRYTVARKDEMTLVDLVVDRAPQIAEKRSFGRVRVDVHSSTASRSAISSTCV